MNNLSKHYDKLKGSVIACIGFILSPFSWWNDLYVNIPIAYVCGWLISLLYPRLFLSAFAGAYLATNILGFILLHKGLSRTLSKTDSEEIRYTKKNFLKDIAISLFYTAIMVLLVQLRVIQPLQHYFK
jgi:hypothetical protein